MWYCSRCVAGGSIEPAILGVDPGTTISGVVRMRGEDIEYAKGEMDNEEIFDLLPTADILVIELFVIHGAVGSSCRDTILFTGRLWQAWKILKGKEPVFLTRTKVTSRLGFATKEARKDTRAMDTKVTELMRELYGDKPKKAGVTYHAWQALGLLTAYNRIQDADRNKTSKKRIRS